MRGKTLAAGMAIGLLGLLTATPARATLVDVFTFTQASSAPVGVLTANGTMFLEDAAFQAGISFHKGWGPPFSLDSNLPASVRRLDFSVATHDGSGESLTATAKDFVEGDDVFGPFWDVTFSSGPGGVPTGSVRFNDTLREFVFTLGDPGSTGTFGTDDVASQCSSPGEPCTFTGTWTRLGTIFIPEPGTLMLLTTGLAGIGIVRRHAQSRSRRHS